jgi:hypothetical protein
VDPTSGQPEAQKPGCLHYLLYAAGWLLLYGVTLGAVAGLVSRRYESQGSGAEGYGAYVAIVGFMLVMPIGLLISCAVIAVWRRVVVAMALAVVIAVAAAMAPVVIDAYRARASHASEGAP